MPVSAQVPGLVVLQDAVYQIVDGGLVYKYQGGQKWKLAGGNPNVVQVPVTRDTVYAHDPLHDTIVAYKVSDGTTKTIDWTPERMVLAASAKFVYKLHLDQNRIYRYSGKDWNLIDDGVQAIAIAVDEDDTLYRHHADGRISKYLGSEGWQEIDSTPNVQSIVAGGGKLYKLHKDGGLYVHVEDYDWDRIDKSDTVQVAAGPAGVFQRRRDNSLWQYDASAKKWHSIHVATQISVDIAVGNTLYIRYTNGELYQRVLTTNTWISIK